eukprot:6186559-Pleurochrysis_carterae.AAC.5
MRLSLSATLQECGPGDRVRSVSDARLVIWVVTKSSFLCRGCSLSLGSSPPFAHFGTAPLCVPVPPRSRLALLTPAELESECAGSWYRAVVHAPVSDDNEQRVAQALRRRLQGRPLAEPKMCMASGDCSQELLGLVFTCLSSDALEADKSSIEEDEALLLAEGGDLDDAMRCAVQLRLNRKRLLAELIRIVKSFSGRPRGSNLLDALGEGRWLSNAAHSAYTWLHDLSAFDGAPAHSWPTVTFMPSWHGDHILRTC